MKQTISDKEKEDEQKRLKELEEEKKVKAERERLFVKEYEQNAERLKQIPFQIQQLKDNLELTKENINMLLDKENLQIKDLSIREDNFKIMQPKYEWELDSNWIAIQKDLILAEIKELEFKIRMDKKVLLQNESNTGTQIADFESQEKRCFESHKTILKVLPSEFGWKPDRLNELKKKCNYKCCR